MNIAIAVLAMCALATALIITGVAMLLGAPFAIITAGIFIFAAAVRLQKVMEPRG